MNAEREMRYRAAEEHLWSSLGVAPRERRVRLPHIGTEVRVQELGTGRPALFMPARLGSSYWHKERSDR